MKKLRLTENKKQILECLGFPDDEFSRLEYGLPPYSASTVASRLEKETKNIVRTLKLLAAEGLVVPEYYKKEVWSPLNCTTRRELMCYWNAATIEEDKTKLADWEAKAPEREEAFLTKLFGPKPT